MSYTALWLPSRRSYLLFYFQIWYLNKIKFIYYYILYIIIEIIKVDGPLVLFIFVVLKKKKKNIRSYLASFHAEW